MEFEKDVELELGRRVERSGGLYIKAGQQGWPDRIVMLPGGRLVWVELKRNGGRLSALQRFRHAQLRERGQQVVTIWSREDIDRLMEDLQWEDQEQKR